MEFYDHVSTFGLTEYPAIKCSLGRESFERNVGFYWINVACYVQVFIWCVKH
jgi:hypothetical protein